MKVEKMSIGLHNKETIIHFTESAEKEVGLQHND